jgi:TetR/AcrR family transcriptional regulator
MKNKTPDEGRAARIKEAAKQLFIDKGYDGTTMQAIANASKVNKALLHYYFKSKDKLFLLIFRAEIVELLGTMTALWQEGEKSFRERMEDWIDSQTAFLMRYPRQHLFIINEMTRNPELIRELLAEFLPLSRSLLAGDTDSTPDGKFKLPAHVELPCTVYSLIFFPAVAAPMLSYLFGIDSTRMDEFLASQVRLAKNLVRQYLGE